MQSLSSIFGESPFAMVVQHARKVHECVALIRPVADAILSGDLNSARALQDRMSQTEYEADKLKDEARRQLTRRLLMSVQRGDMLNFIRQLDRMGDDAEDFAVVATFRQIAIPDGLRNDFLSLVDNVVRLSSMMLELAEHLAQLEKESFEGPDAESVLKKIEDVCHMEWESDKLSRQIARAYYSMKDLDVITVILMEKLCKALTGIADHAENVGKNLRLMILRK